MDAPIMLVIPADARYLHVARAVATGFAAHLALPLDDVEDLRLAIGECCGRLLAAAPDGSRIRLNLGSSADTLSARVSLDAPVLRWPPSDQVASWSWTVISSLADSAHEEVEEGVPTVVTTWRLLTAPTV